MSTQQLLFVYILAATLLMALAWGVNDGSWTQGDTLIGLALLLVMVAAGWLDG